MKRKIIICICLLAAAFAFILTGCDQKIESVSVSGASSVVVGETAQYTVKVTPEDVELDVDVVWEVSGNHAEISETGLLTALSAGTVTVTASVGEIKGTKTVTITEEVEPEPEPEPEPETLYVVYVTNGGELGFNEQVPVVYEEGDEIVLPTPYREDYTFLGWYKDSSFMVYCREGEVMPDYSFALYARWTKGNLDFVSNNNGAYTVAGGYSAYDHSMVIPSVYMGQPVTAIGEYAFSDYSWLESVTIPTSVTRIGREAFAGTGLTSVTVPNSVIHMGESVFARCSSLEKATLSSALKVVPQYTFSGCTSLVSVTIPAGVVAIDNNAFEGCTVLESVVIPNTVLSVAADAFAGCTNLTAINTTWKKADADKLPGWEAVRNNSTTVPVVYDYKAPKGPAQAVDKGITYELAVTGTGTDTKYTAKIVAQSKTLDTVVIPATIKVKEEDIEVTYTVNEIVAGAFENCRNLLSVTVPATITTVGEDAFGPQTLVYVEATTVPATGWDANWTTGKYIVDSKNKAVADDGKLYTADGQAIYLAEGTGATAKATVVLTRDDEVTIAASVKIGETTYPVTTLEAGLFAGTAVTKVVLPDSIKSLEVGIFEDCEDLVEVVLPADITAIPESAFSGCVSLTTVVIPAKVTTIGEEAFYGCESLTTVVVPDKVTSIGEGAFEVSGVESVTLSAALTTIGARAFADSALVSIVVPNTVTSIGAGAFLGCVNLESVLLSSKLTAIADSLLMDCPNLKAITIPSDVTTIGADAFNSAGLLSVVIPNKVTTIGAGAFLNNVNLAWVTIGEGVTSIGNDAFGSAYALKTLNYNAIDCATYGENVFYNAGVHSTGITLTVGNKVKKLPANMFHVDNVAATFANVPKVTSVVFEATSVCTTIGANAFEGNVYLTTIALPDSVTTIGAAAFQNCVSLKTVTYKAGTTVAADAFDGTQFTPAAPAA